MTSSVTSAIAVSVQPGSRNQTQSAVPARRDGLSSPENTLSSRLPESSQASVVISLSQAAKTALNTAQPNDKEKRGNGPSDLSEEEQAQVRELKSRDQEVRRHEQAHATVGGQHAGAPNYEYQRGPDGQNYAVGGHVSIDVAPVNGDPEATIRKMDVVKRAALAPAEPSPADRSVAAQADATRLQAVAELARDRAESLAEDSNGETNPNDLTASGRVEVPIAAARGVPPGNYLDVVA